MKRQSKSQVPIQEQQRELKRANSSLFSIATVVESSNSNDTGYAAADESGGVRCEDRPQHLLAVDGLHVGERLRPPIKSSEKKQQGQQGQQGQHHPFRRRTISPPGGTSARNRGSPSTSSFDEELNTDRQKQNDDTGTCTNLSSNDKATEPVANAPAFEFTSSDDDGACTLETDKFIPVLSPKRTREHTGTVDNNYISSAASCNNRTSSSGDNATGIVFESSERHYDRQNRLHKERALRIISVRDHLMASSSKLLERCTVFDNCCEGNTLNESHEAATAAPVAMDSESATMAPSNDADSFLNDGDYLRVHLPGYMQRLDRLTGCTCTERLDREAEQYTSVYYAPDTVAAAKNAAASLCRLVSSVADGTLDNGFAVIRPPGHHSEAGLAGGYCVINNVAVAAAYAKEKLGMKRILIVDWDVHHGNGTQSIFLNDPDVLYFSVHRYHGGNFFPFLKNGGPTTVGTGAGEGYNVNVGWNQKGMGDDEYYAVWKLVLMPVAREYQPDLVLVSAGFDGALGDMGECCVTPSCFARLTSDLLTLAGGRVVCTLEGGYVRSVLSRCVEAVVGTLLGKKAYSCQGNSSEDETSCDGTEDILSFINSGAVSSIRSTMASHFPYWNCFKEEQGLPRTACSREQLS